MLFSQYLVGQNIDSLSTISVSESDYQLKLSQYYLQHDFLSDALEHCNTGLKIHKTGNDSIMVELTNKLGQVYLKNHQSQKAILQFRQAVNHSLEIDNNILLAQSKSLLGSALEKNGKLEEALEVEKESNKIYIQLNDSTGIAKTLENIGSIYEDQENFKAANEYFQKAKKYVKDTLSFKYANILNNIGDAYRKDGNTDLGILFSKRALDVSLKMNDIDQIESAYKDLSRGYAAKSNHKKAYEHMVKYVDAKEKLLEKNKSIKISSIQARYDLQQKDAEIELLKAKGNANSARQKLFITIGLALLIGLLSTFFWWNKKRRDEAKIKAYEQEALQTQLAQKEAEETALQNKIRLKQLEQEALQTQLDKKKAEEEALQNEVRIKTTSLSSYSLHISHKNKILLEISDTLKKISSRENIDYTKTIKSLVKDIDRHLGEEDEWEEFIQLFSEVHPDFMTKISNISDDKLSPAELRLAVLLRLNMSSKEISSILRITPDSVRVARYRLRKKLPIEQGQDLIQFLMDL